MKEDKENIHLDIGKNLLEEKSQFEEFEDNLKKAIFGVLFVLLRSEEFSFLVEVLFLLLELLQFLSFPFHYRVLYIIIFSLITFGREASINMFNLF